ncbi:MAG TPA: methyltransferase domain-containing protein [Solirubrobacteraceae bacterium]|nr:methyltransferase domain-containing protein [Solirubrobacteraceae bacterium]
MASRHPIFARAYERASRSEQRGEQLEHRRALLAGAAGRVVEVGAGNGLNFALYPATVTEVVAVEPEPYLRARAAERAASAPVAVTVVDGEADALPLADASADVAVASLVLCSVPDQAVALAELRRVLRPGGELRFYEHVVSTRPRRARLQALLTRLLWRRVCAGCHLDRDTGAAIEAAGFRIERCERLAFHGLAHIHGVARRPV